ncbi:MAG: sugar phosphate isomerase/epimerase [Verrucomicrobia bacterium]|nr:sugar phosphate isomerase/epimerase [Verrucomicrobiota bacterium]
MPTPRPASSRRQFLRVALLGSLAAANPLSALEARRRTGRSLLRPALNIYSFSDLLTLNKKEPGQGIDLFGICDFCARHNLEAMDMTGYFFPEYPQVPSEAFISRIKRHAHTQGVVINGTGVRNDFAVADRAVRATGVKLTKDWIEATARLGGSVIRVFAGPQSPFKDWRVAACGAARDEVERWMADDLRACAEHGQKFGVVVGVQNHGDFINSGPEHLRLLQRVDHPFCGALVDTGKYLTPDPYADIAMMVPYAVGWQVKETLGSDLKSPRADFKRLMKILADGGYRGFVPIETLPMGRKDYDPAAEVLAVLKGMREGIAAATT